MDDVPQQKGGDKTAIRPFHVNFPETDLAEMRRRIVATRFPEKETVADFSQGVPLATVQKLARYWATEYDWRKVEARLNAVPNFITEIDGLHIHFIHVRSKHENALPIIITHGWPGSIIEQLKLVEPLTTLTYLLCQCTKNSPSRSVETYTNITTAATPCRFRRRTRASSTRAGSLWSWRRLRPRADGR